MDSKDRLVVLLSILCGSFLVGCRSSETSSIPHSNARLELQPSGETWHATTRVASDRSGRRTSIAVEEEVSLDARGRLDHGVTHTTDDAGGDLRITFDRRAQRVLIERNGARTEWSVPGDEPWIVAAATGPSGEPVLTPLVAWTTYRATQESEWVRLVRPLEQRSFVVPRDQYVVDETVIVGDAPVEVDRSFVRSIAIGGVALARRGDGASPFRFGGNG